MTTPLCSPLRPRVVIIGCGFRRPRNRPPCEGAAVDVTLVDKTNHHLFSPCSTRCGHRRAVGPGHSAPIRHLFRQQRNVTTLLGEVTRIDVGQRTVRQTAPRCRTTTSSWPPVPHASPPAATTGLCARPQTLDDAFEIRRRVLLAFEAAEKEPDPARRADWLNFVVVGAGPTGVEMAGTLAEIAGTHAARRVPPIDPASAKIILLEGGARRCRPCQDLSQRAREQLEKLGVDVRLGARHRHRQ